MSQRKLPDHRLPLAKDRPFSEDDVAELHSEFGFRESFNLSEGIRAVLWYPDSVVVRDPDVPIRERIKLLIAVRDHAELLREALRLLGPAEVLPLNDHWDGGLNRGRYRDSLRQLRDAAAGVLADLDDIPRKGRKPENNRRDFVLALRKIYLEGTGRDERYTRSPDGSKYTGRFVEFVERVSDIAKYPIRNSFIGDTLAKELRGQISK